MKRERERINQKERGRDGDSEARSATSACWVYKLGMMEMQLTL
jgi:hypothetical protein